MRTCPVCENELIERSGKFGPFVCCSKGNHGTFSIQGSMMYFTGAIGAMLKNERIQEVYDQLSLQHVSSGVAFQPSLTQLMNMQMAKWGWDSSSEMAQLSEFALGDPKEMWDQEERDNPNAWWNQRPY